MSLASLRLVRAGLAQDGRRAFSSSNTRQATYGFIGLGRMGLPMARNLRAKIPAEDNLIVFDVNSQACTGLMEEVRQKSEVAEKGKTAIAHDVREVAELSVSIYDSALISPYAILFPDELLLFQILYDLSWRFRPLLLIL